MSTDTRDPIVIQQDAGHKQTEVTATAGGRATDPSIHLVVLVDGNTASAAEILAAPNADCPASLASAGA